MAKEVTPKFAPVLLGKIGLSPHDDLLREAYPLVYELMMPQYEERKLCREPGVIGIRVDGSLYRISMICSTEGLQAVLETPTLMDPLGQLERYLNLPSTMWTPTYDSKKRSRRGLDRVQNDE